MPGQDNRTGQPGQDSKRRQSGLNNQGEERDYRTVVHSNKDRTAGQQDRILPTFLQMCSENEHFRETCSIRSLTFLDINQLKADSVNVRKVCESFIFS